MLEFKLLLELSEFLITTLFFISAIFFIACTIAVKIIGYKNYQKKIAPTALQFFSVVSMLIIGIVFAVCFSLFLIGFDMVF